jgi:hypothetical protein
VIRGLHERRIVVTTTIVKRKICAKLQAFPAPTPMLSAGDAGVLR